MLRSLVGSEMCIRDSTSFQAGNMSLPDFRKLQEEDEYCNKIKQLAETDQIAKHFHIRQGLLICIFSPSMDDPDRRKTRPPTKVLPAVLVNMIIDSETPGAIGCSPGTQKSIPLTQRKIPLSVNGGTRLPKDQTMCTMSA